MSEDKRGNLPTGLVHATAEHVTYCFDVLFSHLHRTTLAPPTFDNLVCPLFVTWYKEGARGGEPRLRGCIGTLEPRHLHTGLRDYALASALRDRRFSAVEKKELPHLQCSASLLHSFENAASWSDWVVGKHGIIIEFQDDLEQCTRSATFLPHVAPQEGWNVADTIAALVRKSGYAGVVTPQLCSTIHLTRYQSTAYTMTYAEYREHKNSIQEAQQGQLVTVAA